MENTKPEKKRRVRSFISRKRKPIMKMLLALIVLGITAGIAYNMGVKQAKTSSKNKATITSPSLEKLKDAAKNSQKNLSATKESITSRASNSSGFFRLSGTIQSVKSQSISIKVGDGSVIVLAVGKDTKFYGGTPRKAQPISNLKVGTPAFVIGTIGANGTFTASNIQAQK